MICHNCSYCDKEFYCLDHKKNRGCISIPVQIEYNEYFTEYLIYFCSTYCLKLWAQY